MKNLQVERWDDPSSYLPSWSERNMILLRLLDTQAPGAEAMSFSEYGCGPKSPFATAVRATSQRTVFRFDRKKWDDDCRVADFNTGEMDLCESDVGVLSGVVEYVNDIDRAFATLKKHHRYLLVSYAFRAELATPAKKLEVINQRALANGWRNHLTVDEFVGVISKTGFIITTGCWQERQMLACVKFY